MGEYRMFTDRMTVTVPEGEVDGLRVEKFEVTGQELWNVRQELRYGRGCKPGMYTRLVDYKEENLDLGIHPVIWMSDTTAERDDHKEAVAHIDYNKSQRVLINGLGLGMVLQASLTYDHVTHVDVVEKDERVIELVGPHYLKDRRVKIHHADAYEKIKGWEPGPVKRWHTAWSDIWPEIDADNIEGMDRLHEYYKRRSQWHGMWARKMCLKLRREKRKAVKEIAEKLGL